MNSFKVNLISFSLLTLFSCNNKERESILAPKEIDLGTVFATDTVHSNVEITNLMNEDLIIKRVSSSCGCTLVYIKDSIIKPNEKIELPFEFITDFEGEKGYTSKAIVLETNSPQRFHEIIIKAKVE